MTSKSATNSATFQIPNSRDEIGRAESALAEALDQHHFSNASKFAIRLAMEEALVNAFKHGHKHLPATTPVRISFRVDEHSVQLDIEDKGPGFDPANVPDPTLEENLEKSSGRGLLLMRAYMTSIEYLGRGNHLRMVFKRV